MGPATVFFFALLCTAYYIHILIISITTNKDPKNFDLLVIITIGVILWTVLYYLTH
jgi:hypothetical protein